MAAGDTIPSNIAVFRKDTTEDESLIIGPYSSGEVDTKGQAPSEKLYINTAISNRRNPPLDAREETYLGAKWFNGEKIRVKAKSNADNAESIDVSANEFKLQFVVFDENRGRHTTETLTVADNEVGSDPAESATEYVTFFEFEVPQNKQYFLVGLFEVAPVEAA